MLKFMWNGIKLNGKLYKGFYTLNNCENYPSGTITLFAMSYTNFPRIEGLEIINNSDSMTDYFEKDRFRITPDNTYYKQVHEAYLKQVEHNDKIFKRKGVKYEYQH